MYSERVLAVAIALGLHAAILPWWLSSTPKVLPTTQPQAVPMQIEVTSLPSVTHEPMPVTTPLPVSEPTSSSSDIDKNAQRTTSDIHPHTDSKPKAKPKLRQKTHKSLKPVTKPTNKPSVPQSLIPSHSLEHSMAARPSTATKLTPPLANAGYLHNPAPEYPDSAMERGLEGTVLLRVQVNAAGKAIKVEVYQSSGTSALDEAALRTVRHWTFVPAKRGSDAVEGQVIVPIDFSLNS